MLAIADDLCRTANGGGHYLVADDHHPQVETLVEAFQQHPVVMPARGLDGRSEVLGVADVHRHALALFAVDRLHH